MSDIVVYVTPGGFAVAERRDLPVLLTPTHAKVLSVLVSEPRVWSIGDLEDAIWGSTDRAPETSAALVKTTIHQMRRLLGHEVILTAPKAHPRRGEILQLGGYRISEEVDIRRFEVGQSGEQLELFKR